MANRKIGFNYYSVDTDRYQDIKIKRLKKDFGCTGIAVFDYILNEIYRVKGCFIAWDESTVFDVAEYYGIKESVVTEVVNYCCVVGLFNKELLTSERVLTSKSIQVRYVDWSSKAKRLNANRKLIIQSIPKNYNILPEESANLPEETTQTSGRLPQSKVTESKVTESKVTESKEVSLSKKERQSLFQFFVFEKNVREPYIELERFCNHYNSVGWKDANGNQILEKFSKARMWKTNKSGLRCDIEVLNKWKQVFNLVYQSSGEIAYWLLHFSPKIENEVLILQYQKLNNTNLRKAINTLEDSIGEDYFSAIKSIFKGLKVEYLIYKL